MRLYASLFGVGLLAAVVSAQSPPPVQRPPAQSPPAQQPQQPQQPVPGQQPPVIRSGINFVSVDVIVSDKKTGEPIFDLTKDDFDVREDKKPQTVQTFETVKIDPIAEQTERHREIKNTYDEELEAKGPNVRLFIILLDDYHVRRGNDLAVRPPLINFIQNQLGPQDMVAIMDPLTPVGSLNFTRDKGAMIEAVNHFIGRKGDYTPHNAFEDRYAYYPTATVEDVRNDVSMGALKGAAVRLGGMREGRKSIIWVSEGFLSNVPAALNNPNAALPGGLGTTPPPPPAGSDPRIDSQKFFNQADLFTRMREVFDTCNRNNTSIYAVDPRGLAAFEYGLDQPAVGLQEDHDALNETIESLRVLADNTDGRAIVNRNDLAAGMKQIMRDASGYYLLGYTSSSAPTDGKFHTIDVHVKRPNVEVRARKGYWAYTNEDAARAAAPVKASVPSPVARALDTIVEPASAGHAARFWVGTAAGTGGANHVTFVWEPLAVTGSRAGDAAARVMLTATAPDGRPLFHGRVPDPAKSADAPAAAPATDAGAEVSFDAPPGPIQLRMVVEGSSGQVIDSTTRDLTVPDYAQTQVSFATPRVYRARTAREAAAARNDPSTRPVALREFSRGDRVIVRVEAYAAGGGHPDVTAKLLNRDGHPIADVPFQAVAGQPILIDMPLASLAPGAYVLQLDARTSSGTAQELIPFKVGT